LEYRPGSCDPFQCQSASQIVLASSRLRSGGGFLGSSAAGTSFSGSSGSGSGFGFGIDPNGYSHGLTSGGIVAGSR